MNDIVRAQRPVRLPVVLSRDEVMSLLSQLRGPVWLMASLMYGREGRGPGGRHFASSHVPFAQAQLRDPPARGRVRHPNDSGTARTSRREHDHDLHPRPEPGRTRCSKPAGPTWPRREPPLNPLSCDARWRIDAIETGLSGRRSVEDSQAKCRRRLALQRNGTQALWRGTLQPPFNDRDTELSRLLVRPQDSIAATFRKPRTEQ